MQLPDYDFWQYWRNTDDRDVGKFLRLFTDLAAWTRSLGWKRSRAARSTTPRSSWPTKSPGWCRGEEAAGAAEATAAATFAAAGVGEDLPVLEVPAEGIRLGQRCTDIGFTASNGEAKRKIAEGAVRIDDEPVKRPRIPD